MQDDSASSGADPGATIDMRDPGAVEAALRDGAAANRGARCRRGSIDVVDATGAGSDERPAPERPRPDESRPEEGRPADTALRLIATGDLHDNPLHFEILVRAAGMDGSARRAGNGGVGAAPAHLTLHEIIHGDRLLHGMDFSYRVLARVAALKAAYPEHVHVLLGNHELAQMQRSGILKDGVRCVDAFSEGLAYAFGEDASRVEAAIDDFVLSMPLALRVHTRRGDILCAHSVPPAAVMGKFDTTVLSRELTIADYAPRQGAAHLMVWGRGYDEEGLEDLVEAWGVYMFVLGHEKAPEGSKFVAPNAVVLNSDHEKGVYLPLDLTNPPTPAQAMGLVRRIMAP
ncbi:MAG: hypothetical protein SFY69_07725 [Planctomycetota bacterium]|nr:hypothetical protein [Planctomycetota bacterium]